MAMKKKLYINVAVLAAGICLAFVIMIVAYALPSKRVEKHIHDSINILEQEGNYYEQQPKKNSTCVDNFTEILYLELCFISGGKNILDDVLSSYCLDTTTDRPLPLENLLAYYDGEYDEVVPRATRFWNGYVAVIKPLLMLCSYGNLRNLNIILQLFLAFLVMQMLYSQRGRLYSIAFFWAWIMQNPITIVSNLMYSGILYSTLVPMLLMLRYNKKIKSRDMYDTFFLIIGMETVFFNMNSSLCMPFGFCMVLYFILNGFEGKLIDQTKIVFEFGISWLCGFIGMMLSKWILASIFTNNYSLADAINTIRFRTATDAVGYETTRWNAIRVNVNTLIENKWAYLAVIVMFIGCLLVVVLETVSAYRCSRIIDQKSGYAAFWYCILSLIPFIWYGILPNHSLIHLRFTYRTLTVGIFATLCGIVHLIELLRLDKSVKIKKDERKSE